MPHDDLQTGMSSRGTFALNPRISRAAAILALSILWMLFVSASGLTSPLSPVLARGEGIATHASLVHPSSSTGDLAWSEMNTLGGTPVSDGVMVYDAADGYDLLVGEYDSPVTGQNVIGTWAYAHGGWTNFTTPIGPASDDYVFGASIAYDSGTGVVLLQIANNSATPTETTWQFHAGHWAELFPPAEPSPRWYAAMAYDPALNETALFGGLSLVTPGYNESWLNDTWAFSNDTWNLITAGPPTSVYQYSQRMAYDPATGQLILLTNALAGKVAGGTFAAMAEFTGDSWDIVPTTAATSPGVPGALVYDPALGGLVAINYDYWTNQTSDMWVFAGGSWSDHFFEGAPIWSSTVGYDALDGYLVMASYEYTLNVSGPSQHPVTWILSNTSVGAPPQVALEVKPSSITLGSSITAQGSFTGAFGYTSYRIGIYVPGCSPAMNNQTLSCTPQSTGTYSASFEILDQAGRMSNVSATFAVSPTPTMQAFDVLPYVFAGVGAVVVVIAAVVLLRRRGRRARKTDSGQDVPAD